MKKMRVRNHVVVLNRSRGGDIGIFIGLAIIGVIMLFPLVYTVMNAFKSLEEFFYFPPIIIPHNPTAENFTYLFQLLSTSWVPFSRYIFNTVFITIGIIAGNLIISCLAGYALAKIPFPGHNFVFQLCQKSLMFSATVASLIVFIIMTLLGWIDNYFAYIIPAWASCMNVYLMKQFMETNVTEEMLESARLDGSSEFRTFMFIAMPLVKPAIMTLIIYSFQGAWSTGASPYVYSEQLKTLNYAIGQILSGDAAMSVLRTGASAASGLIMMVVPMIVFVISESNIVETMGSSGMKD